MELATQSPGSYEIISGNIEGDAVKDVEAVHRENGIALFNDGTTAEIIDWYDDSGDYCEPEDATFCVARDGFDYWSIDLSNRAKGKQVKKSFEINITLPNWCGYLLCISMAAWGFSSAALSITKLLTQ